MFDDDDDVILVLASVGCSQQWHPLVWSPSRRRLLSASAGVRLLGHLKRAIGMSNESRVAQPASSSQPQQRKLTIIYRLIKKVFPDMPRRMYRSELLQVMSCKLVGYRSYNLNKLHLVSAKAACAICPWNAWSIRAKFERWDGSCINCKRSACQYDFITEFLDGLALQNESFNPSVGAVPIILPVVICQQTSLPAPNIDKNAYCINSLSWMIKMDGACWLAWCQSVLRLQ